MGNIVNPDEFITDPGAAGYGGYAGRSNVLLAKVDSKGSLQWIKSIESENNIIAYDAIATENGSIYVVASLIKFPEKGDDLVVYKFDPNGELIWTRTWEQDTLDGYAIAETPDANFVITGIRYAENRSDSDVFVKKIDPEGNEIWAMDYGIGIFV